MGKKDLEGELQSRRAFFKNAARTVLPILGSIVLLNSPIISSAAEKMPMGCTGTCYGTCTGSCEGCKYTCSGTCKNGCDGCRYTCTGTCKNSSR